MLRSYIFSSPRNRSFTNRKRSFTPIAFFRSRIGAPWRTVATSTLSSFNFSFRLSTWLASVVLNSKTSGNGAGTLTGDTASIVFWWDSVGISCVVSKSQLLAGNSSFSKFTSSGKSTLLSFSVDGTDPVTDGKTTDILRPIDDWTWLCGSSASKSWAVMASLSASACCSNCSFSLLIKVPTLSIGCNTFGG